MARKSRKRTHNQSVDDKNQETFGDDTNEETFNGFSSSYIDDANYVALSTRPEGAPEGVHHYQHVQEVPEEIQSYFRQRYRIFKSYNHGVWMTDKAWYGATQEAVANKIANHIKTALRDSNRSVILDVMAGAGGNTIGFAKSGHFMRTYAFEKDPATLACAKHNAEIYGVHDQITSFEGDCFDVLANNSGLQVLAKQYGVIFCSPPWGGPNYRNDNVFNLDTMEPYSLRHLYTELSKYCDHIVLYLPRSSDLRQIAELVEDGKKVNVIHYCTEGSSRALCVYFGPFDFSSM